VYQVLLLPLWLKQEQPFQRDGVLTVAADQTGELVVKANIAGVGIDTDGAGADTTDVYGESIVTISI
jgi:hypothetical protein